jgi:hypothetical protein
MDTVKGEDHHHDEVRHEQADVEGVPAVVALEGAIRVMGLPVVRQAVLIGKEERESVGWMYQGFGSRRVSGCGQLQSEVEAVPADWTRVAHPGISSQNLQNIQLSSGHSAPLYAESSVWRDLPLSSPVCPL